MRTTILKHLIRRQGHRWRRPSPSGVNQSIQVMEKILLVSIKKINSTAFQKDHEQTGSACLSSVNPAGGCQPSLSSGTHYSANLFNPPGRVRGTICLILVSVIGHSQNFCSDGYPWSSCSSFWSSIRHSAIAQRPRQEPQSNLLHPVTLVLVLHRRTSVLQHRL